MERVQPMLQPVMRAFRNAGDSGIPFLEAGRLSEAPVLWLAHLLSLAGEQMLA